jgi:antitoxin VapB
MLQICRKLPFLKKFLPIPNPRESIAGGYSTNNHPQASQKTISDPVIHVPLAVRIPRESALPGNDAIMRKDGNRLIIEAVPPRSLLELLATLEPLSEPFPPIHDQTPDEVEI